MIGEVYIGDQLQKSSKNKKPRVAVDLEAKQRVVASLVKRNASSIPIDRRSTYSSEQSTETSAVEFESGDDEEDEVEWLGQVASQLGAASATDVDDSAQRQKKEARPITRNSTASSLDGSADLKLAAGGLKSSASIPSTSSCSDKERKQPVHCSLPPSAFNLSGQEPQKKIGEVGYTFRKLFDDGWFEGKGAVVFSLTAVSAPGEALVFCCVTVFSYHAHSLITFARMPSLFLDSCSNSGGST
jgi:hypothetical protein